MSRVSQAQAQMNRERVVAAASRLFREQGVQNVSVADLMKSVGLTHGGFYKQFASKEALVEEAADHAAKGYEGQFPPLETQSDAERARTRSDLIDYYLSPAHRDDRGGGCPTAGFVAGLAQEPPSGPSREKYAERVRKFADRVATDEDDGDDGLARLCTMVGALLLARATSGSPVSDDILSAAHAAVAVPARAASEAGTVTGTGTVTAPRASAGAAKGTGAASEAAEATG
jgi:TetR/AcrR family transcriptional repressor of nem operon